MPEPENPEPFDAPSSEEIETWFPQLSSPTLLAVGGAGAVYRCDQNDPAMLVALKLVPLDESESGEGLVRDLFERERDLMARLDHPGIRAIHSSGEIDGFLYFLMEFIDGYSLHQHLKANGTFRAPDALIIIANLASALAHAHAEGVVHLDVKPDNVMIDTNGVTKLTDFGIAQTIDPETQLAPNTREGSHNYAAPEQFTEEFVDHRADLFALGSLLFELLKGHPLNRDVQVVSQLGSFPPKIRVLLQKLLAESPDLRFQAAAEVYAAVSA